MRGTAILCLLLALAGVRVPSRRDKPSVAFLLDISDSVGQAQNSLRRLGEYIRSLPKGSRWCLIPFADGAALEIPLTEDKNLIPEGITSQIEGDRTDIESALKLALSVLPSDAPRRIAILSDGDQNLNDVASLIPILRSEGIELYTIPISRGLEREVLIEPHVRAPWTVRLGRPFELVPLIRGISPAKGRLTVYRNGEPITRIPLSLKGGIEPLRVRDQVEREGSYEYRFHLEASPDTIQRNNDAYAWISVRGRSSLLFVGDEDEGKFFVDLARKNGIAAEILPPEEFPDDVSRLVGKDVIVMGNLSSNALTMRQMEAMRLFVRDIGGGMLMLGGDGAFGAGGYFDTPIEELSPLNMDPRGREQRMALVALVDKSGSMANYVGTERKIDLAVAALEAAINSLRDDDLFGCIAFDAKPKTVFKLNRISDRSSLVKRARAIRPGSGTNMYAALKLAYEWLRKVDLPLKHVITVTDGRSQGDFPPLVRRMAADGITVSAIAVGDEAREVLMEIASEGKGRYYDLDDLSQLPRVFVREAHSSRDLIVEYRFVPILKGDHPIASPFDSFPALDGYVATSEKDTAQVILASERGDPILAVWRYGLGRAVAFTSQIGGRWGEEWARWDEGSKFWMQVIRWLMPEVAEGSGLVLDIEGGRGKASIEMADEKGYPMMGLILQARIVKPDSSVETLPMVESSAGRYETEFNMDLLGRYIVSVVEVEGGREAPIANGSLYLPYSPEYADLDVNETLLRRLALETGGIYRADPDQLGRPIRSRRPNPIPIWRWLILASVILVMLELILRKVIVRSRSTLTSPSEPADIPKERIEPEEDEYIERLLRLKPQA
jgi:uncharacterized membrane protein